MWWLRHKSTHNLAPIDAEPVAGGNVSINLDRGEYIVLPGGLFSSAALEQFGDDGKRYTNHFFTCPNAARHRKSKKK